MTHKKRSTQGATPKKAKPKLSVDEMERIRAGGHWDGAKKVNGKWVRCGGICVLEKKDGKLRWRHEPYAAPRKQRVVAVKMDERDKIVFTRCARIAERPIKVFMHELARRLVEMNPGLFK